MCKIIVNLPMRMQGFTVLHHTEGYRGNDYGQYSGDPNIESRNEGCVRQDIFVHGIYPHCNKVRGIEQTQLQGPRGKSDAVYV